MLKRKDQVYVQSLVDLLVEIEGGARDLDKYENKPGVLKFGDAVLNRKTGPAGVLKLVEICEDRLSKLQIHQTAKGEKRCTLLFSRVDSRVKIAGTIMVMCFRGCLLWKTVPLWLILMLGVLLNISCFSYLVEN